MITEIAATLSFSAIQNNDKTGVILFSDKIEKFIPPQKGKKHILYIIRELLNFEPESRGTDVKVALQYLTNVIKKRCTTFLISDFVGMGDFKSALSIANQKHDIVAMQVYDKREATLPNVGLVKMKDAETQQEMWVNSSSARTRENYNQWWQTNQNRAIETCNKCRVDTVSVATDEDYVVALMTLLKRRS